MPARRLATPEPGRYHTGIVEDQQIVRVQKIEQFAEPVMAKRPGKSIQHHQPAGTALGQWVLGNQLRG